MKNISFRTYCNVKVRRTLALILMLGLVVSLMSGCDKKESISLTVRRSSISEADQEVLDSVISRYVQAFEKENPDVTVNVEYVKDIPADISKTDAVLMSCDSMLEYIAEDAMELSSYMTYENVIASAIDAGKFGGKLFYIPFNYDRAVIYADKSLFEARGVSLPGTDWTYDSLNDMCRQFVYKEGTENYTGIYMPYYMPYTWRYYTDMFGVGWYDKGTYTFKGQSNDNKDAYDMMLDIYKTGCGKSFGIEGTKSSDAVCAMSLTYACAPDRNGRNVESKEDVLKNPGTNAYALLEEGKLAMLTLPTVSGKRFGIMNTDFIHGFCVSKASSHKTAAARLAMFSLSDTGARLLNEYYGGIPVNKDHWSMDFWKRGLLSGGNADTAVIGIENDIRDDYAVLYDGDSGIYDKNIRARTVFSYYVIQQMTAVGAKNSGMMIKYMKNVADSLSPREVLNENG